MANEFRVHQNFVGGRLTAALSAGGTTMTSTAVEFMVAIGSAECLLVTIDPDGIGGAPEAVTVTAHTLSATTATITRGSDGTSARAHVIGIPWVHSILRSDVAGIQRGAGTPEGVVTATVGTLFLRSDGSTSTTLYVKTSGTGNTGWTAK